MPKGSGYNSQGNHYNTPGGTNSSSGSSYHCEFRAFDQFVLGWHVISRFSTCGFLDTPKHKPSRLAWDLRGSSSIACSLSVWTCVTSAFRRLYLISVFSQFTTSPQFFILLDLSLTAQPIRIPRHRGNRLQHQRELLLLQRQRLDLLQQWPGVQHLHFPQRPHDAFLRRQQQEVRRPLHSKKMSYVDRSRIWTVSPTLSNTVARGERSSWSVLYYE